MVEKVLEGAIITEVEVTKAGLPTVVVQTGKFYVELHASYAEDDHLLEEAAARVAAALRVMD